MKSDLVTMATYNLWANSRLAALAENLENEKLHQPVVSSFPGVFKTLLHIWDAEYIWLQRLKGFSPREWPGSKINTQIFPVNDFLKNSSEFQDFVSGLPESGFGQICQYKNIKGENFETPFSGIIMHCMNHSNFHRGQLVTLFRQIGINEIPATDMIVYLRNLKNN